MKYIVKMANMYPDAWTSDEWYSRRSNNIKDEMI